MHNYECAMQLTITLIHKQVYGSYNILLSTNLVLFSLLTKGYLWCLVSDESRSDHSTLSAIAEHHRL
jgi:hypothetical protein